MRIVKSPWMRVIGIVGGLGPHSHLVFERHLLDAAGHVTTEQEYPPWILVSYPWVPDRTKAISGEGESPVRELAESLRSLKAAGAGFAVIICNTAHYFLSELAPSPLPILDMVAEGLRDSVESTIEGAVGLLATTGTLKGQVYERSAQRIGFMRKLITMLDVDPSGELQRRLVMEPIYGRSGDAQSRGIKHDGVMARGSGAALREAVTYLASAGARAVIMGCTEIPLVLRQDDVADARLIDPMVSAARAAVAVAKGQRDVAAAIEESR